jgi:hypothetical protein
MPSQTYNLRMKEDKFNEVRHEMKQAEEEVPAEAPKKASSEKLYTVKKKETKSRWHSMLMSMRQWPWQKQVSAKPPSFYLHHLCSEQKRL